MSQLLWCATVHAKRNRASGEDMPLYHRCDAADLQGLVDLLPCGLGGIQSVDELDVVQQVAGGTGQQLQNLVLQLSLHKPLITLAVQRQAGDARHGRAHTSHLEIRLQSQ